MPNEDDFDNSPGMRAIECGENCQYGDLRAEIERLLAALKDIADFSEPFLASTAYVMRDKARAAYEQRASET